MQPIAAWLVARPQNAIFGLAAILLLPLVNVISGMIVVLLVLKQGARMAILQAGAAAILFSAVFLVTGMAAAPMAYIALVAWGPAIVVAVLLQRTQSLTLTLQVLSLVLVGLTIAIFGVAGDIVELAKPLTTYILNSWRAIGLAELADTLAANPRQFATQLLISMLWTAWVMCVLYLLFGYRFYRRLEKHKPVYGMFRDVDFGRVLAMAMAVAAVAGFLADLEWLQNVAIVMIVIFALQGLAVAHFALDSGMLPLFLIILVYILLVMPVLNNLAIVGLAAFGFSDVWVRYRPRIVARQQDRDL